MEKTNNKIIGMFIGIAGATLAIISLFLTFAESHMVNESLFGIAKLYINSDSGVWGSKEYETFYKIFVPTMLGLIILFAIIYLITCVKMKPVGMIVSCILTIVAFEVLKWDFSDRGIVPGSFDKGVAFTMIYIVYAVMIAGIIVRFIEKAKNKA